MFIHTDLHQASGSSSPWWTISTMSEKTTFSNKWNKNNEKISNEEMDLIETSAGHGQDEQGVEGVSQGPAGCGQGEEGLWG